MTEHETVVGIPPIVGPCIVSIQLQLVSIFVQVEHVRVAIAISYVNAIIYTTTHAIENEGTGLYFMRDQESPRAFTKYISFLDVRHILYAKP